MVEVPETLFGSWVEVHSFVIGFCLGTIVVVLWSPHRRVALGVLLASLAVVLLRPTAPLDEAGRKPWYFLVALSTVFAVGTRDVSGILGRPRGGGVGSDAIASDDSES